MEENMFRDLIENYQDFHCYSMDMDQMIDELVAYGYTGTTAMHSRTPSGTGSWSSASSVDGPPPSACMDLTGGLLDRTEKPPDLDKMVMMTDASPVMPQAEQKKTPIEEMPPDSNKKKKTKKKKEAKRRGSHRSECQYAKGSRTESYCVARSAG